MKKTWIVVLSFIMAIAIGVPTGAQSVQGTDLVVGVTTGLSGHFFTDKWGINTADIDVKELIHGHNTIAWEQNGAYALNNTVLRSLEATNQSDMGDKTYRLSLNEGLMYNDGSPITAYDYAFSALLLSSPEFAALGGAPTGLDYLAGYEAFQTGQVFSGVRVIDELTLELTLDGRYLPYYYEIVLLNLVPYPIGSIAPFCSVKDDGMGAYIDGPFTTGLLRDMILNEESGYLYKPYVSAGPYRFSSFDSVTGTARFVRNDYYAGNFEGVKPTIERITVVTADRERAMDDLLGGRIDLINKVAESAVIERGRALAGEEQIEMTNYLRTGLSFIAFACELEPTNSLNVRKALAHCVDAAAITEEFAKGYGVPVYGYYGQGQWMAIDNQALLEQYEIELDPNDAIRLLQEDGWVLNEEGGTYRESEGGVRYRMGGDGLLEKLSLNWAQSEKTAMSDILTGQIMMFAETVGFDLAITRMPFEELLTHYYRQADRTYHMFSMATNFNLAFDPYSTFHVSEAYQGEANKTGIKDDELMNLALMMRRTAVGDDEAYVQKWLAFQERFNEVRPMIPLYSNMYFDFFRSDLQGYRPNGYVSWATAIVYAYIGEPAQTDIFLP